MQKGFDEFLLRIFSDSEDDELFSVPVPGVPDSPNFLVEDGCLMLSRQDMKGIFDPIIAQIIGLVQEQIKQIEGQKLHLSV